MVRNTVSPAAMPSESLTDWNALMLMVARAARRGCRSAAASSCTTCSSNERRLLSPVSVEMGQLADFGLGREAGGCRAPPPRAPGDCPAGGGARCIRRGWFALCILQVHFPNAFHAPCVVR